MFTLRLRWSRRVFATVLSCVALVVLSACQPSPSKWRDIAKSPDAVEYSGEIEPILAERLNSIVTQSSATILGSRVERLPDGVDWETYKLWRQQHVGLMDELNTINGRIPEPDAPVLVAQYGGSGRTLVVIARADDTGKFLVVLTALIH